VAGALATSGKYFLGIDGGATHCRARLRDAMGAAIAERAGPAANIYVNFDAAMKVVRGLIAAVADEAGLAPAARSHIALGLGLAGLQSSIEAESVRTALDGFASVHADNDAVIACLGAHGGADGAIVIAGTGSAGMAMLRGRRILIGGRGFLIGDEGSGARIGCDAVRAAVLAHDGLGPSSELTAILMRRFAGDANEAARWAAGAAPKDYGELAPLAFAQAARGDRVAVAIIANAAHAIAALVSALHKAGAQRVALLGGVGAAIRPLLPPGVAALLSEPLYDATDGAILLAGGILPASVAESAAP
jgi:glucosamine kinase